MATGHAPAVSHRRSPSGSTSAGTSSAPRSVVHVHPHRRLLPVHPPGGVSPDDGSIRRSMADSE